MARVNVTSPGTGGSGAVSSVNTRTGAVVLTAADVGAGQLPSGVLLPSGVIIPSGADMSGVLGATGATAAAGNDSRLSDTRTPTDGSVTNAKVAANAAIALSKLATDPLARANHTGTQLMATISDAGALATKSAVASADITDGTIVSADLSATAGITSGQLAGSIAPSKITGTAVTAADTGTVTSAMILDGTIVGGDLSSSIALPNGATATTQSANDNSTKAATTAYADNAARSAVKPNGVWAVNIQAFANSQTSATAVTTALKPTFVPLYPISESYVLSGLGIHVGAQVAASTAGLAIYSIVYSGAGTYLATLVAQLNASIATTTSNAWLTGLCTTGAVGSGASTYTFDFRSNEYIIGSMVSTVTTLTIFGATPHSGLGCLSWTDTARSSVTDWPSSFTQVSGVAVAAARINATMLYNADGANWL